MSERLDRRAPWRGHLVSRDDAGNPDDFCAVKLFTRDEARRIAVTETAYLSDDLVLRALGLGT